MNKQIASLLAVSAAAFVSAGAWAQAADPAPTTTTTTVTTEHVETVVVPPTPPLTKSEAKDLKTLSTAKYKARKNTAEANHDINKGDCKVSSDGAVQRACKSDVKAQEKKEKADAKVVHEQEMSDIKANSK